MKKKFLTGIFALALLVTTGYGVQRSISNNTNLNELALANVEALASGESGGTKCYNSITTKESSRIFYCGSCDWEDGTNSWYSGTSTCTK